MRIITLICTIFAYVQVSFGQQASEICAINIGSDMPDVSVTNIQGQSVNLIELTRDPTVLVFYRGGWCPYCTRHLSALQEAEKDIVQMGYQIVAVSADKFDQLENTIEDKSLTYKLYSDNDLVAADAFGIVFEPTQNIKTALTRSALNVKKWAGKKVEKLPVPAVFVVNKGEVLYRYVNPDYSTRLSSEMLLAALKSLE